MNSAEHSDLMFRRFLERISDYALFLLDKDGRVGSWNEGARAIIGYDRDEIVGQPVSIFFTAEAQAGGLPVRALAESRLSGRFDVEDWQVRKDGERFWAAITMTAIHDDDGAITGFGAMIRDLTGRLEAEAQKAGVMALLEKTAGTDFLTGAANRRSLDAALIASIATAKRHARPLSIAMADIDHFKAFNDGHGHQAGDRYLKAAITAWKSVLRAGCLLARYGGEEFTVLLPDTALGHAMEAMNRLRLATPAPNTCSIGVAQWDGIETAEALLHRADQGLYAAKRAGRNRVEAGPGQRAALSFLPETGGGDLRDIAIPRNIR
ncbi:MAG: sensor domain-containing diguanylate cyclase [Beijerinckiaceae bacterium]|nr:sensor domain-containing diguanylate cyclase [Beijerinckiaceae bacterium]